eukprot:TRINITY_DN5714_c0_g1_i3.p1 TRINITY_DN5714_c0_g1~~TRINITY_DN5714_c0_g1_i3.p1  ORF type:complete len:271 (+),score=52.32 TRINITY_DN5714_c0_g1_i3:75-887(+)
MASKDVGDLCLQHSWTTFIRHHESSLPSLVEQRLHVSMSAHDVMQHLPHALSSLGSVELCISISGKVRATIFQDYVPHEVQVSVSEDASATEAIIGLCEPETSDPVRFQQVLRALAVAFHVDLPVAAQPEFVDDFWSDEDDCGSLEWKEHIEDTVSEVLSAVTALRREELMQTLASWSDRSIAAKAEFAKFLATPRGIYFTSCMLRQVEVLSCRSVRLLFPFAVILKNAAASPAAAGMQPMASMIRNAMTASTFCRLVRQELEAALSHLG